MATTEQQPLALKRLEDHLWQAADLFRNKVSNQKDYILSLLFFKRASDLYREETGAALEQLGDVPNADELARDSAFHILQVPSGHTWDEVRGTDEALQGQALNDALAAIGRANPKQLAGVFERTDFNNKMALPSDDLARIIEHFHKLGPLDSAHVATDMLGQAYEWLIAKFAAASGKGGGEFYTPAEVGQLMAALLEPREGDRIYDPTCGSGGLLLQCLARAQAQGVNPRSLFVYGQELNPETWAIARMNMLLHGAGDAADIKLGDTLATPAFVEGEKLRMFDVVVANPPFSSKNWGHERFKAGGDPFGRIKHLPPKRHGEVAFLQHMLASVTDGGRLAVVLPNGVFFRGGAELAVRRELVDADIIETIIQLPPDLFYGAGIPACVLVVNFNKPADRRGRLLLIDASTGFDRRDTKNVLTDEIIERIVAGYVDGVIEESFSTWVTREDVVGRRYNLGVRRYFSADETEGEDGAPPLPDAVDEYRHARAARAASETRIAEELDDAVRRAGVENGDWRTVSLREIAILAPDRVKVSPEAEYRVAGVYNAGKGLFWREIILGKDTTYPTLHRLHEGQLVYRKLTAWEGPITVVTAEFEGAFVSTEFPVLELDQSAIEPAFMSFICQRPSFWDEMRQRTQGAAVRRSRMNPEDLLDVEIEIPNSETQRAIVALLGKAADLARSLEAEGQAAQALLVSARETLVGWAETDGALAAE